MRPPSGLFEPASNRTYVDVLITVFIQVREARNFGADFILTRARIAPQKGNLRGDRTMLRID